MPTTTIESSIQQAIALQKKQPIIDSTMAQAGVMVLVYPKKSTLHILLNKRSQYVDRHKGEIAFPGGAREKSDATIRDTALRETWEEMGIIPDDVTVLGELDDIVTISDFVVTPYVGTIPAAYDFSPNVEVAEVIEVPVAALLDTAYLRDDVRLVNGKTRRRATYAYDGHLIWGATAMILEGFVQILDTIDEREAPWKTPA